MRHVSTLLFSQRGGQILAAAAILFAASSAPTFAQTILAESTFDIGDQGWSQVNLDGDYRYVQPIEEPREDGPPSPAGALGFCDPDAGQWMFKVPSKFLGNKSAALDGYISFSSWDRFLDEGWSLDTDPYPNVVIASADVAIVIINQSPSTSEWTTYRYELNEQSPWLWVDGENDMDSLPLATRQQIERVLGNITGLIVRGEAIIGDDQGLLDNFRIVSPGVIEPPVLRIRIVAGKIETSWPDTASDFVLETCETLPGSAHWIVVDTQGTTKHEFTPGTGTAFFRLRKK